MTDTAKTDDWPSHAQELSRKTLETLDKWMARVDAGQAKKRDLYVIVDALWDAVSGLADKKTLRILEHVHEELRKEARKKRDG